jgi:hypothetical protein
MRILIFVLKNLRKQIFTDSENQKIKEIKERRKKNV